MGAVDGVIVAAKGALDVGWVTVGVSGGMADLCQGMIGVAGWCFGPTRKRLMHRLIRLLIYDDVAWAFQMVTIHLYIA